MYVAFFPQEGLTTSRNVLKAGLGGLFHPERDFNHKQLWTVSKRNELGRDQRAVPCCQGRDSDQLVGYLH